jgi:hypothetical protein
VERRRHIAPERHAGGPGSEVLILPANAVEVPARTPARLTLGLPSESTYVQFLKGGDAASWRFAYA